MLPTLSSLSVSFAPEDRFRHRCSSGYLCISPLHPEFHLPIANSRQVVSEASPKLSPGIPLQTDLSAYAPFTPSNSEQRLEPPYYRGCWHGVSRSLFLRYRQAGGISYPGYSSLRKELYNPRAVFAHAAWLDQAFAHCPIFLLLPPVGVWTVSQFQCGRSTSQLGYPSKPWWAIIPPTS